MMSNQDKEIIKLNLQLVSIRIEHQIEKYRDLIPKENVLQIVQNEIEKQLNNI